MKSIPWYEWKYSITEDGIVYRNPNKTKWLLAIKKPETTFDGYIRVRLHKNWTHKKYWVHRLVAMTYLDSVEGKTQINHKNWIRDDNRVENLEWCTHFENQRHSWEKLGRVQSEISMEAMRNWNANKIRKKIMQLTREWILCKIYQSLAGATIITGLPNSSLCNTANWKQKTCGGYLWKYI